MKLVHHQDCVVRAPTCFLFVSILGAVAPACGDGPEEPGSDLGGPIGGQGGATEEEGEDGKENEGAEAFLPLYESGSRLRAVTQGSADGGERLFVTWYDSELETECSFLRASDGEYRCLPSGQQLSLGYRDEACTEAVYFDGRVTPCQGQAPYRVETTEMPCAQTRVFSLQPVSDVSTIYHETCEGQLTVEESVAVWQDDEEMAASVFVRAELVERANSAGIGVVEWRGEDGSRQVTTILDEERGACHPRQFGGGEEWRCAPNAAYLEDGGWWFSGEACSGEQLAYGSLLSECSEPVDYVFLVNTETLTYELARAGDPVEGTVWQQGFGADAECTEHTTEDLLWTLYPVVEEYDETLLPLIVRQNRGAGRVQLGHSVVDGVWLTPFSREGAPFYDTETRAECEAVRYRQDEWLCVPKETPRTEEIFFADSSCTEPLLQHPGDPPEIVLHTEREHCTREPYVSRIAAVYAVGEPHEDLVYFVNHEGCVEHDDGGNDVSYFSLSEETVGLAKMTEARE